MIGSKVYGREFIFGTCKTKIGALQKKDVVALFRSLMTGYDDVLYGSTLNLETFIRRLVARGWYAGLRAVHFTFS